MFARVGSVAPLLRFRFKLLTGGVSHSPPPLPQREGDSMPAQAKSDDEVLEAAFVVWCCGPSFRTGRVAKEARHTRAAINPAFTNRDIS